MARRCWFSSRNRDGALPSPLFRGHGEELVVFPDSVDLQVAERKAFFAESGLFEDANRGPIDRHHRCLDAMELELPKRDIEPLPHRLGGVPASVVALRDGGPEIGALERGGR